MSIIGPRPGLWNQDVLTAERDKYGANDVKPGLTGWAQINGRDELEIPEKAKLDGYYVQNMGFKMDAKVFLRSVHVFGKDESVVEGGTGEMKKQSEEKKIKKKILVICQYYKPEPFRISDICEEMVRRGHEVHVVTGYPNYPEGMPKLATDFRKNNHEEIEKTIQIVIKFSLFASLPMMFGLMSISRTFIPWFLGRDFLPVASAIAIIAPIIVLNSLANISGNQYFTATNQTRIMTISYMAAAILNIIINAILIPKWQYKGAAIATLLSALISVIIQYSVMRKQIRIEKTFLSSIKYLLASLLMFCICYALRTLGDTWHVTLVQIFIGILVYIIVLLLAKDEILMKIIFTLVKKETKHE